MIGVNLMHAIMLCAIPIGMSKIEDKRALSLYLNISVAANHTVIGTPTGAVENIVRLPFPMFSIIRPIDPKPLPGVSDHPVSFLPAKYIGSLVSTVGDHRAEDCPSGVVEIADVLG